MTVAACLKFIQITGDLNSSLSNVFQILDSEAIGAQSRGVALGIAQSSRIIDISSFVGYTPGSIFLTSGLGSSGDQIALLVSPTAMVIPESSVVVACLLIIRGTAL
jgi:hypothetical protein